MIVDIIIIVDGIGVKVVENNHATNSITTNNSNRLSDVTVAGLVTS